MNMQIRLWHHLVNWALTTYPWESIGTTGPINTRLPCITGGPDKLINIGTCTVLQYHTAHNWTVTRCCVWNTHLAVSVGGFVVVINKWKYDAGDEAEERQTHSSYSEYSEGQPDERFIAVSTAIRPLQHPGHLNTYSLSHTHLPSANC